MEGSDDISVWVTAMADLSSHTHLIHHRFQLLGIIPVVNIGHTLHHKFLSWNVLKTRRVMSEQVAAVNYCSKNSFEIRQAPRDPVNFPLINSTEYFSVLNGRTLWFTKVCLGVSIPKNRCTPQGEIQFREKLQLCWRACQAAGLAIGVTRETFFRCTITNLGPRISVSPVLLPSKLKSLDKELFTLTVHLATTWK